MLMESTGGQNSVMNIIDAISSHIVETNELISVESSKITSDVNEIESAQGVMSEYGIRTYAKQYIKAAAGQNVFSIGRLQIIDWNIDYSKSERGKEDLPSLSPQPEPEVFTEEEDDQVLTVFIPKEAMDGIVETDLPEVSCRHRNYQFEIVDAPLTFDASADEQEYTIQGWSRTDTGARISEYGDQVAVVHGEPITLDTEDENFIQYFVAETARFLNRYFALFHYWESHEKPDENEGILISFEEEQPKIRIVGGKQRPDLLCFKSGAMLRGEVVTEVCRPYSDEVVEMVSEELLQSVKNHEETVDMETDSDEDDYDFIAEYPRVYASIETLNRLNELQGEVNTGKYPHFPIVIEMIEMPYTLIISAIDANIERMLKTELEQVRNQSGKQPAKVILAVDRMVFGTYTGHKRLLWFVTSDQETIIMADPNHFEQEQFGPIARSCYNVAEYLNRNGLEDRYLKLDAPMSGLMMKQKNEKVECRIVSGDSRPDLVCFEMNLLNPYAKDIVTCRPYEEDIQAEMAIESMSEEEKTEAADSGNQAAMKEMALAYLNGTDEIEQDAEKAYYWFEKLAEAGDASAMFNAGLLKAKGFGTKRDFSAAAEWMRRASEAGDEDADVASESYQKLADAVSRAEDGDGQAMAELANGLMQLGGSLAQAGSGQDYEESVMWAQKAVELGIPDGYWALALAYHHGRGVPQNISRAIEIYQMGAEAGSADCMHNLGCEYMTGVNVAKDTHRGFALIKAAAEAGNGLAMRDLGKCYQFAEGTTGNMLKAIEWYEKALEKISDPELEQKTAMFRMLAESDPGLADDYPEETDEVMSSDIPDDCTDLMQVAGALFAYDEELENAGVTIDTENVDFPRVRKKAAEGDEKAVKLLNMLASLNGDETEEMTVEPQPVEPEEKEEVPKETVVPEVTEPVEEKQEEVLPEAVKEEKEEAEDKQSAEQKKQLIKLQAEVEAERQNYSDVLRSNNTEDNENKLSSLKNELSSRNEELEELGRFSFGRKKELVQEIERLNNRILQQEKLIEMKQQLIEEAEHSLKKAETALEMFIDSEAE